jgi:hypothetical protein
MKKARSIKCFFEVNRGVQCRAVIGVTSGGGGCVQRRWRNDCCFTRLVSNDF